jgi:hypothetical protein
LNNRTKHNKIILIVVCLCFYLCLVCGVVEKLSNRAPIIKKISSDADSLIVATGDTVKLTVEATDPDKDELSYSWDATGGYFLSRQGKTVFWIAPDREGDFDIEVTVRDHNDGVASDKITLTVISKEQPQIVISYPKNGDYFVATENIDIQVQVTPTRFIDKVEFFVNDRLVGTDLLSPYTQSVLLSGYAGDTEIKATAYRKIPVPVTASDSLTITVEGVIPIPRNIHGINER